MIEPEDAVLNRGQEAVRDNIKIYLKGLKRDKGLIEKFDDGYCSGISTLWLYSKYLQKQPKNYDRVLNVIAIWLNKEGYENKKKIGKIISSSIKSSVSNYAWVEKAAESIAAWAGKKRLKKEDRKELESLVSFWPEPRDDYDWFKSTRDFIVGWDGKSKLTIKEKEDIERFIYHIEFFQNIDNYLSLAQGSLVDSLEDTRGRQLKRKDLKRILKDSKGYKSKKLTKRKELKQEYSIASLFTLKQLKTLLKNKRIIQNNRLVLISSYDHDIALFKDGKSYYCFDPNDSRGEFKFTLSDDLAEFIFDSNDYENLKSSPLGFRIFSFDKRPLVEYPPQKSVLKKISPSLKVENNYADDTTGLMQAADIGCVESVKYFLKRGCDPNLQDSFGKSSVQSAAQNGRLDVIREFLKKLENGKYKYNVTQKSKSAAFMSAAEYGHLGVLEELLNDGVDCNVKLNNVTALVKAAENGWVDAVKFLLQNNAIPNILDFYRVSPLEKALKKAAKNGHVDVVKEILNNNGFPISNEIKIKAFMKEVKSGNYRVVKVFLDGGMSPNAESDDETALMLASENGHLEVVDLLLKRKAKVGVKDFIDKTALMLAATNGYAKVVRKLLKAGANPNTLFGSKDATAFTFAAEVGHVDTVKEFFRKGVRIKASKKNMAEAFVLASGNGHLGVVKVLLANGVDPNACSIKGKTAIEVARKNNHFNIIHEIKEFLKKHKEKKKRQFSVRSVKDHLFLGDSKRKLRKKDMGKRGGVNIRRHERIM